MPRRAVARHRAGAVYRRNGEHVEVVAPPGRLGSAVRVLIHDHDGNLWIATRGAGLVRWRDGAFSAFDGDPFARGDLRGLLEDDEGSALDRQQRRRPAAPARPEVGAVRRAGGTAGEARVVDRAAPRRAGSGSAPTPASAATRTAVPSTSPDRTATRTSAYARCSRTCAAPCGPAPTAPASTGSMPGGMTVFNRGVGLSGDSVMAIAEDRRGRIWVGTNVGARPDRGRQGRSRFRRCCTRRGPTPISLIHEDRRGTVWVATEAHGLFVIDEHGTRHLGLADGLPSDWVIAIHEDERGILWLGTTDGLAVWRGGRLVSLARFGGPLRETILQMLEDDRHQLWMTTNKGLVSVARDALDALASRRHGAARAPCLRRRRRPARGRVRRRQHQRRLPHAGRPAVVPGHHRHRARRPAPPDDEPAAAAGAASSSWPSTARRSQLAQGMEVAARAAAMGVPLHRPQPARAEALAVPLPARGFRQGLGRRRHAPHRVLHAACRRARYTFRVTASNNDGVWSARRREPALHAAAALLPDAVVPPAVRRGGRLRRRPRGTGCASGACGGSPARCASRSRSARATSSGSTPSCCRPRSAPSRRRSPSRSSSPT